MAKGERNTGPGVTFKLGPGKKLMKEGVGGPLYVNQKKKEIKKATGASTTAAPKKDTPATVKPVPKPRPPAASAPKVETQAPPPAAPAAPSKREYRRTPRSTAMATGGGQPTIRGIPYSDVVTENMNKAYDDPAVMKRMDRLITPYRSPYYRGDSAQNAYEAYRKKKLAADPSADSKDREKAVLSDGWVDTVMDKWKRTGPSQRFRPSQTSYKDGGRVDRKAIRGKTRGKFC